MTFAAAGALVAGRLIREHAESAQVEEVVWRVVYQCVTLTR
jgi:hypothetical protein